VQEQQILAQAAEAVAVVLMVLQQAVQVLLLFVI
jgi:hypothetical protein